VRGKGAKDRSKESKERDAHAAIERVRRAVVLLVLLLSAASAGAQVKNWPSERPPRPLAAHDVKFPPYAMRTLDNGLQVIAVSHHEEPAVSLRLLVRAGSAQDPENRPGVASLASSLLDQGTTTKSAERIATAIDSIGGALGTGAGPDLTYINCIVMKDSLNVGLDLVADLVQHPAFAPEEIERQRQQLQSALKVSYDDPEYLANMVFDRLVYGFHPYGRPQNGTPAALGAITREDLLAFHQKWFGANNAILAIVGDVTPEEAFAGAARALSSWARSAAEPPRPAEPPPPTRRLVIIDKPGAVQTEIRAGNVAIPRKHGDYTALDLAVKVLGGEGANRLHRVLRSERGLTYGASADLTSMKQSGDIQAQTNTRSATTGETLRLMVDECWKLIRDRVGERELEGAQEYLTGSFPLTIETPSQIATQILNAVFYGLDLKDLQTFRDRVNRVTVDDIQRVSREYLHPDKLTIVLVGDASSFVNQLAGAGFDKFERIPLSELDLSSADLRRKSAAPGGGLTPVAYQVPVTRDPKVLIEQAIAAKGGLETLRSIKTVRAEAVTTIRMGGSASQVPVLTSVQYPDRFRIDADMPAGKVVQVFADNTYWVQTARGIEEMPDEVRNELAGSVQRDIVPLLLRAAAGQLTLRSTDSHDPLLDAVILESAALRPVTLFIEKATGNIVKERYTGAAGTTEEEYSEFRRVDGVQVAFRTIVRRAGAPVAERALTSIRYNVPLAASLFVKPS
jgi:zinc protease